MTPAKAEYGCIKTGGWAGRVIRVVTRSPVNHVVYSLGDDRIIEAQPGGVRIRRLRPGEAQQYTWSSLNLTDQQRETATALAATLVGRPYSWLNVFLIGLTALGLRWRWLQRRLDTPRAFMCSQLASYICLHGAGVDLCPAKPSSSESPGDLLDVIEHKTVPQWR